MAMELQQQFNERPLTIPNVVTYDAWLESFKKDWRQGEHVSIIGPTGTGKTTIAHSILDAREYVCVLAVKRFDDTLQRFKSGHRYGRARYDVIRKWPPDFNQHKVIYWQKPTKIEDQYKMAEAIHNALNEMYRSGGWCIYLDECGYIAGNLGLGKAVGVLLNQGRSAHISMVCTMTRPHSMIAKVPVETLNQCRHHIIFKYQDEKEIKATAEIAGIGYQDMRRFQYNLHVDTHKGFSDFVYIGHGSVQIVRNVTGG